MKFSDTNKILQGDCRKVLCEIPDGSVDLVFADPPYFLQLQNELLRPDNSKVDAVEDGWDKFSNFSDYDKFTAEWLISCRRVMKDTGTIWVIGSYHNIYRVGKIMQDLDFWILNDIVWIKTNPMPNFRGVRFTNAHETLIWAQKKQGARYTFNHHTLKSLNDDLQMRSDWLFPINKGKERIKIDGIKAHSTQKPEELLYRVITSSSNPGDTILDPFFGSGTTGAVAKKLNRNWIGIEQDERYIPIAQARIDRVTQTSMEWMVTSEPRQNKRIPFGALLECGYLSAGQTLWWINNTSVTATIRGDGKLICNNQIGSIHSIVKILMKGIPTNGWISWYFADENGNKIIIDELRQKFRDETITQEEIN